MGMFVVVTDGACGSATPAPVMSKTSTEDKAAAQGTIADIPAASLDARAPLTNAELSAAALASKDWPQITRSALNKNELCAPAAPAPATGSHPDHIGEQFHLYMREGNAAYAEGRAMPEGAMIVKRSFSAADATATTAYFLMYKRAGQNPSGGDWLYATTQASGEVIRAGALADCAGCHDKQREQDFLFRKY